MGKFIYKALFYIQSFITRSVLDSTAEIWYRNSLLQDYFTFGKSDIDVSVEFKSDEQLIEKADAFAGHLQYCPLIKEINFYSPFSLKHLPSVFNTFELKKDPILAFKATADNRLLEAQKLVYLLRMYFSNLNNREFGKRDVDKWTFHLKLTEKTIAIQSLRQGISRRDLLEVLLSSFDLADIKNNVFEALWFAVASYWNKKELFDQFKECQNQNELYTFLPHQFCFVSPHISNSLFAEQVLISQLSWEIAGMMNQPLQFKSNGPGHTHLRNLKKTIEELNFKDANVEEKRKELQRIANEFLDFLNPDYTKKVSLS